MDDSYTHLLILFYVNANANIMLLITYIFYRLIKIGVIELDY